MEDKFWPGLYGLVGHYRLAAQGYRFVAVQAAPSEWTSLHLAAVALLRPLPGRSCGSDHRQAVVADLGGDNESRERRFG